ncbi:MAG TPA: hypothetical protein VL461_08300 [Dictyobacter sp.]|nr:hypothetical protein [Dictyobacter sp.]
MIQFTQPYKKRPIRFLELWESHGWRIKIYGISTQAEYPPDTLVQTAKKIAQQQLPQPAVTDKYYGIAYIIVHEGENGDYVLVDWWYDQDIVQHHNYGAPKGSNTLKYHWPSGPGFCVWELAICWFEREAWLETVLKHPQHPDIEGYLQRRLHTDI